MDRDRIEWGWEDIKDRAKETWGRVTGDLGRVAAEAKIGPSGSSGCRLLTSVSGR